MNFLGDKSTRVKIGSTKAENNMNHFCIEVKNK